MVYWALTINEVLFDVLQAREMDKAQLSPNGYDRLPRRLLKKFLSESDFIGRWRAEQQKQKLAQVAQRKAVHDQQVAAETKRRRTKEAAQDKMEAIRQALMYVQVNPERRAPQLGSDDLKLITAWAGASTDLQELTPDQTRQAIGSSYEFSRLWSAREAELAAMEYYRIAGQHVEDIAVT